MCIDQYCRECHVMMLFLCSLSLHLSLSLPFSAPLLSLSPAVKGTGGMLVPSPPVEMVTSPVITWLQWTPSRLRSEEQSVILGFIGTLSDRAEYMAHQTPGHKVTFSCHVTHTLTRTRTHTYTLSVSLTLSLLTLFRSLSSVFYLRQQGERKMSEV